MKVDNILNTRGNKAVNQFEITDDNGNRYFQSYKSVIVKIDTTGKVFLDSGTWNYSKTTVKFRNLFLNECTKETVKKIKEGIYTLTELN